jgi:hypothetical protein
LEHYLWLPTSFQVRIANLFLAILQREDIVVTTDLWSPPFLSSPFLAPQVVLPLSFLFYGSQQVKGVRKLRRTGQGVRVVLSKGGEDAVSMLTPDISQSSLDLPNGRGAGGRSSIYLLFMIIFGDDFLPVLVALIEDNRPV